MERRRIEEGEYLNGKIWVIIKEDKLNFSANGSEYNLENYNIESVFQKQNVFKINVILLKKFLTF